MNLTGKVKAIEARTAQMAMLKTAQDFGGFDAQFYAAALDGLADRGALKRGCDELQRLAKENNDGAQLPDNETKTVPAWAADMSDSQIVTVIMWEVFQTAPRSWRMPGGEAALLRELREEDESLAGKSSSELKAFLDSELERLAKVNQ